MIRSKEERGEGNTVGRNTYEQGLRDAFVICDVAMAALASEGQRVDGGRVCVRLLQRRLLELGYTAPRTWSLDRPSPPPAPPVDQVQAMRDRIAAASAAAAAAGEAHQRVVDAREKELQKSRKLHAQGVERDRLAKENRARERAIATATMRIRDRLRERMLAGVTPQTMLWDTAPSLRLLDRLAALGVQSNCASLGDVARLDAADFKSGALFGSRPLGELRQVLSSAGLWLAGDEEIDMRDEQ